MSYFAKVCETLIDAFRTNVFFLTQASDDLLATELRDLVGRDLAILVHHRSKDSVDVLAPSERWPQHLDVFVARSLRPRLAGESVAALWNDAALRDALDRLVATEQVALARVPQRLPVAGRFGSGWAG
jgi:hypothetical protein